MHVKNVYIKSLFIKIDNKIVLKINDVKLIKTDNYTKEALNLHKTILTTVKFLNIFQSITVNNLSYGKIFIKHIKLQNNNISLLSDFMQFKGVIYPQLKKSYINLSYLKLPKQNLAFRNVLVDFEFQKKFIKAHATAEYNNSPFHITALLNDSNILDANLSASYLKGDYNGTEFKISSLKTETKINLNYFNYGLNGKADKINLQNENKNITLSDIAFNIKNGEITLKAKELYSPEISKLQNIYLKDLFMFYSIKHSFLDVIIPKIYANYQNSDIYMEKSELILRNKNNFNFNNTLFSIKDQKYKINLHNIHIAKTGKILRYSINGSDISTAVAQLSSKPVIGDLQKIYTHEIAGKVFGFDTNAYNVKADIQNKTLTVNKLVLNKIPAYNIKYIHKSHMLYFSSDTLFNDNIKKVIFKFKDLYIPIVQTSGENNVTGKINLKTFKTMVNIESKHAVFNMYDMTLIAPAVDVNVTDKNISIFTDNAALFFGKDIKINFRGRSLIDYYKYKMDINTTVNFKLDNIISLNNFKENILIDFRQKTLKTENSGIYADFIKKTVIINPLSKILKYTIFKPFIKDGIVYINYGDKTKITSDISLKAPILFKHSNTANKNIPKNPIKKLSFQINLDKNETTIFNKNLYINIENQKIFAQLNDMDINLYPLEQLLLKSDSKSSQNEYNITLTTKNANLMYKQHKFLSQKAEIFYQGKDIKFNSKYKKSSINGYTKQKYLLLEGKNFSKEEFNAFLPNFNFFKNISLDFVLVKSPDEFYTGKIYINKATVKNLKTLNNVIAFINTVPALLSFSSPGYSAEGYKVKHGYINYLLYKKILYIKEAKIYGENLDFFAKGYIDFNKNYIFLKVKANMKMKLKNIPIIGKGLSYLFFGKDGSIDIKMVVKGNLDNPEVKEDIGKEILITPFKLFKRAITLPFNLF